MRVVIFVIVIIAFLVVAVGSVTLGRWMQRKGSEIEKGNKDRPL